MKIALLNDRIPPEGRGGAESVVWRLARGLSAAGHKTHVIATTAGAPFEETRAGIPTYHIQAGYPDRFRAWLSLWNPQTAGPFRQLLRRIRPDVVNAHNIHFLLSYHTLKLARDAGCGVVFSAHDALTFAYGKLPASFNPDGPEGRGAGDYRLPPVYNLRQNRFRYNPFRSKLIKRALERHTQIRTAPSRALAAAFRDNNMPPIEVVRNGIDLDEWPPVADSVVDDLRQRLDLPGKRVILIAGRLTAEKGLRQMLLVLSQLQKTLPDLRLLVLTSRDIDSQVPAEFAHLRPAICRGGWLSGEELRAAYQLADVVAVPSIYLDPFPTVVLEAMAAGTPVVASAFGGAREAVVDGETGFVVNPFDSAALCDSLLRLLTDDDLRRRMGLRGRERIAAHFTLDEQLRRMLEIYERALASR
ncbi:MAG: glycosyltransferase family 4 protein [Chloroflexota bacterium]|nr:glycosyltransferase family 4 protein [Chloroflexota bacterium]MDE2946836.1 glycosyltransferase family 4 protein [Chloroflexota bacterium]